MDTLEIPNKSMFKLNEVCGLTGVKPYVLRFWESEFEEIDPIVSSSGQKLYEPKDIEAIATIKKFLFEDKMNIEEAKHALRTPSEEPRQLLDDQETISFEEIQPERIPTEEIKSRIQVQRMALSVGDIEKLVTAKNLLQEIVNQ